MTKSKLILVLLLALTMEGCDVTSTAVVSGLKLYQSIICGVFVSSTGDCTWLFNAPPPADDIPAAASDAAPFHIWIAEANSATAMSEIQLDPAASSSPTITPVSVFAGKHAGGITAWLDDSTQKQYGLYLWHDNTVELLSDSASPAASMAVPVSGNIWDFSLSKDGLTGVATVKGDTHLYVFDLAGRKYVQAIDLGTGANPRASAVGVAPIIYATDAVNGTFYIANEQSGTVSTLQLTGAAELGKPAVNPSDNTEVWVPDVTRNRVFLVNTVNGEFSPFTLPNLFDPRELVFNRNGSTAYILYAPPASFGPGSLAMVNTADGSLTSTIKLGNAPSGLALSPQGNYAFVANSGDGNVAVVDSSNNVQTYGVGKMPIGVVATH